MRDVFHWTATRISSSFRGDATACKEVILRAHPNNKGRVWVRVSESATRSNAMPLDASEVIGFDVTNLNDVYAMIEEKGDILIVAWG